MMRSVTRRFGNSELDGEAKLVLRICSSPAFIAPTEQSGIRPKNEANESIVYNRDDTCQSRTHEMHCQPRISRGIFIIAVALLSGCQPRQPATEAKTTEPKPTLDDLAPHASGVSLVEIVEVEQIDERPSDGSLYRLAKLRTIDSTGITLDELYVTEEYGGHSPGPRENMRPDSLIPLGSLQKGARFWLATYVSGSQLGATGNNPEFVLQAWPADDPIATEACRAAIEEDHYRWRPQYDPSIKLALGHRIDKPGDFFTIRVEREGKELWQQRIEGTKSERYASWGFWGTGYGSVTKVLPQGGKLLIVEAAQELGQDNEFELEPKTYYVKYGFDPLTGTRRLVWVSRHQDGQVDILQRGYAPDGTLRREIRFDWEGEDLRRTETEFDDAGKPIAPVSPQGDNQ